MRRWSAPRRPLTSAPASWLVGLGLVFVLVTAASVGYLLAVMIPRSQAEALRDWEIRLTVMAEDREAFLEGWTRDFRSDAETLAGYPTAVYVLAGRQGPPYPFDPGSGARTHLRELLVSFVAMQDVTGAAVYDSLGRLLVGTEGAEPPEDLRRSWVREAVRNDRSLIRLHPGQPPRVVAISPVHDETGRPLGVTVVEADPATFLFPLLTHQPTPSRTGETVLVARGDDRVTFLSPRRKGDDGAVSTLPVDPATFASGAAVMGVEGPGTYRDYSDDEVVAVTRVIDGTDWALVAKVDRDEALARHRSTLRQIVAALLGLLVGAFGIAFGLWRRQRNRLAAAVLQEQARIAAILNHANDPIIFLDRDGGVKDVNRRAEAFYGRDREELLELHWSELHAPRPSADPSAHVSTAVERGEAVAETEHLQADGTVVPVELSTRAVELDDELILISIVRDIRERKAAEEALRSTEERYRTLVENSPDLILRFGKDLRCRFISPAEDAATLFAGPDPVGCTPEEL
ncbi:MAG: PAS domain S-box protein, partial [Gemmatimonadota bacterium]